MKTILIIRGGALGDFIVTLPVCDRLRNEWPEAQIDFLGNPSFAELGYQRYYFDGVRSLERGTLARFFAPEAELDPEWMDYFSEFDLIVSYLYDPDDFFHTNLARCTHAQVIRGTPQVQAAPAARHFFNPLKELGLETNDFVSRLHLKAEEDHFAQTFLAQCGENVLAFHPGSESPDKNWPLKQWRELLSQAEALGYHPLLIAGEAEQARLELLSKLGKTQAIGLPLPHLAGVLKKCSAYIGHDSGVSHLAAAVGTPTITLFGPTDPDVWAPPGKNVTVFRGGPNWTGFQVSEVAAQLRLVGRQHGHSCP